MKLTLTKEKPVLRQGDMYERPNKDGTLARRLIYRFDADWVWYYNERGCWGASTKEFLNWLQKAKLVKDINNHG